MFKKKIDLYQSIKSNNLLKLNETLISFNIENNEFFDDKITFVSLAVLNGNQLITERIIQHGFDLNKLSYVNYNWPSDEQVFTSFEPALITAIRHNDIKTCRLLLENNANINKTDSFSMTAIHWASSLNLLEITQELMKYELPDPTVLDLKNQTALEKAILNRNKQIVQLFNDKYVLSFRYREYLLTAIESSNDDIFKILLSQVRDGKVKFDLNLIDSSLGSLLHYAVIMCNVNNVENGRSIQTTKDLNLDNILNSSFSKLKIIECLLAQGVEINLTNKLGETPLHMCRNRHVCKLLLDNGAITGIKEITGKQPLYSFLLRANYDMCVELIKSGCELDTTDRLGNSLLCTLMNSNAPAKLILLLLEAGIGLKELSLNGKFQDKIQKDPKLFKAIEYRLKNPPSLKESARKSLRLHLNKINRSKSIVNSVSKLEKLLPSSLQDYILLNLNNFNGPLLIK